MAEAERIKGKSASGGPAASGRPPLPGTDPSDQRRRVRGPELSVVVVTYHSAAVVGRCLDQLQAELSRWGGSSEVLVVDNASTDRTVAAVEQRSWVRLLPQRLNLGFAAGVNVGLRHSRGRYVLLLNPDCFFVSGLGEMVAFLDARPDVAAVGPRVESEGGGVELSCGRFPTVWSEVCENFGLRALRPRSTRFGGYLYGDWDRGEDRRVDWLTGACLLLRMQAVEQVGPMDEDYFLYTEEVDLQWRLWRSGWDCWYLAGPRVLHQGGGSVEASGGAALDRRLQVEFVKSLTLYFRKHHTPFQARWHRRLLALAYTLRLARSGLRLALGGGRREWSRAGVLARALWGLCTGFDAERSSWIRLRAMRQRSAST